MSDSVFMKIRKCRNKLSYNKGDAFPRDSASWESLQNTGKVTSLSKIRQEVNILLVLPAALQLKDVGVTELLEQVPLVHDLVLPIHLLNLVLSNHLHCKSLPVLLFLYELHRSIRTVAESF